MTQIKRTSLIKEFRIRNPLLFHLTKLQIFYKKVSLHNLLVTTSIDEYDEEYVPKKREQKSNSKTRNVE